MLALPVTNEPPAVRVNVRGQRYVFHGAQGGRVLQLERRDGVAGDRDAIQVGYQDRRLTSFRYQPQRLARAFMARVGLALAKRERAVFEWSGIDLPADQAVEFRALAEGRGVEFRNDSKAALRPVVTLNWMDGASSNLGTNRFESVEVPPGAIQRLVMDQWPSAARLRSELDLNADGTAEQVSELAGTPVSSGGDRGEYQMSSSRLTTLSGLSQGGSFQVSGMLAPLSEEPSHAEALELRGGLATLFVPETTVAPPPRIQVDYDQLTKTVTMRWASAASFAVEETDDLQARTWKPVAAMPAIIGDRSVLRLPAGARERFFRLRQR
jgi:hypothetical protein